jgi:hypothetical protein
MSVGMGVFFVLAPPIAEAFDALKRFSRRSRRSRSCRASENQLLHPSRRIASRCSSG